MNRKLDIGFVTNPNLLNSEIQGGVQICSQEYIAVIELLGMVTFHFSLPSQHPIDRLKRKFLIPPYLAHNPAREPQLLRQIKGAHHDVIFVNHSGLTRFVPAIKNQCPDSTVIVLSHGNQTGDDLFESAHPQGRFHQNRQKAVHLLGSHLLWEAETRISHADGVITMSRQETIIESWLGSPNPFFFPRIISPKPISNSPERGRIGFVGTLDHTPNRIALNRLFGELRKRNFSGEVRIAGGPQEAGITLCEAHPFVTYLGPISEHNLIAEATTWSLALNPVFWLSRGASMKLKTYLNWGLPTLSTTSGSRGYAIPKGCAFFCEDDAESFADEIITLTQDLARLREARSILLSEDTLWPSAQTIAHDLKTWLQHR